MKNRLTISKKIALGSTFGIAMTIACGLAGYYAAHRHKETAGQLEYIAGKGWSTANGTMDAMISIESAMIAVQNVLNNYEIDENKKLIEEAAQEASGSLQIVKEMGIIETAKVQELNAKHEEYNRSLSELLNSHRSFVEKEAKYKKESEALIALSEAMEEIGDGAVEELEQNPEQQTSWNSGLSDRWAAADGGMESFIGFLQQQYYIERLIKAEPGEIDEIKSKLEEAIALQSEAMEEMFETGLFDVPASTSDAKTFAQAYREIYTSNTATIRELVDSIVANNAKEADYIRNAGALLANLESFESEVDALLDNFDADVGQISTLILSITVLSVVVAIVSGTLTFRSIVKPIKGVSDRLNTITDSSISTTGEVSRSSRDLADTASSQAAAIEETRSSIEQIAVKTDETAQSSTEAARLSSDARSAAEAGASEMDNMRSAMDDIKNSSNEISNIIKTIDEIAFQTNILALNAAVEAARAGDAGAGFAVVADEVRSLALRSATAAQETASLIEDAVSKSQNGVDISGRMADSLSQIVERAQSLDRLVDDISSLANEQREGIGQIREAIESLDQSVQRNASNADSNSQSALSLESQSQNLKEAVSEVTAMIDGKKVESAFEPSSPLKETSFDQRDDFGDSFAQRENAPASFQSF